MRFHFLGLGLWLLVCGLLPHTFATKPLRCLMYLTGQHQHVPTLEQVRHVTHVAVAFVDRQNVMDPPIEKHFLWANVTELRKKFMPGTKFLIAIGGWGETELFSWAARNESTREAFADNVVRMVKAFGADGIDLDWEYPGGNGEDYKKYPNRDRKWEVEAYPLLLAVLRAKLGPRKIISAAVPGKMVDMIAFKRRTLPRIMKHVDFLNVMTYDLMNRRDNVTFHHSGIANSIEAIDAYIAAGAAPQKLNLGLAFYVKWFKTEPGACKTAHPIGCPTVVMEDPTDGSDLGMSGAFSWNDTVPDDLSNSFDKALREGSYDPEGGDYYLDVEENIWWTYDTPNAIRRKFPEIVAKKKLGGAFAWGLGEDAPFYMHLEAVNDGLEAIQDGSYGYRAEL